MRLTHIVCLVDICTFEKQQFNRFIVATTDSSSQWSSSCFSLSIGNQVLLEYYYTIESGFKIAPEYRHRN